MNVTNAKKENFAPAPLIKFAYFAEKTIVQEKFFFFSKKKHKKNLV